MARPRTPRPLTPTSLRVLLRALRGRPRRKSLSLVEFEALLAAYFAPRRTLAWRKRLAKESPGTVSLMDALMVTADLLVRDDQVAVLVKARCVCELVYETVQVPWTPPRLSHRLRVPRSSC